MGKENKNISNTSETVVNDTENRPEHVIEAEISVDIVGDDTPKMEYSNPWGTIAVLSFFAMPVSLFISGIAFLVSFAVFLVSISLSADKSSDRANNPWKYKD